MACVSVRAFPLQLLLLRHPDWQGQPVAVVDHDKPLGIVLCANKRARNFHIGPGMRYASALSLCAQLRGGSVSEKEIENALEMLTQHLWRYSPWVEPSRREPGIFWLDAEGLQNVYPQFDVWADAIQTEILRAGFHAVVAVGFSRFGAYAAAKTNRRNLVFQSPSHEHAYLQTVPVERINLPLKLHETLSQLGINTLGQFVALPSENIFQRLGSEAEELHRLARGAGWSPLDPRLPVESIEYYEAFEHPENNLDRLMERITELLGKSLAQLEERHETLTSFRLTLTLSNRDTRHETITPAAPMNDARQLLLLARLRLESFPFSACIDAMKLQVFGVVRIHKQLDLLWATPQRTLDAAEGALAKLRAKFGNRAVMFAQLQENHLPEASYHWQPLFRLGSSKPSSAAVRPLVRRIHSSPTGLPSRHQHEPDGWMVAGLSEGPVEEVIGPQYISGGWWAQEVSRAYYYVRTRSGRWLWIYHDMSRRRWFLQGEIQ